MIDEGLDDFVEEEIPNNTAHVATTHDSIRELKIESSREVVHVWRQLVSNALGFFRGITDRLYNNVLITDELLSQFSTAPPVQGKGNTVNILGTMYDLMPPKNAKRIDAYSGEIAMIESDHSLYSVKASVPHLEKDMLVELLAGPWTLLAESPHSVTWQSNTLPASFIVFIPGPVSPEVRSMSIESEVANAILFEALDRLAMPYENLSFSSMEGLCNQDLLFNFYPLEHQKAAISGHLIWMHGGIRRRHAFTLSTSSELSLMSSICQDRWITFKGPFMAHRDGSRLFLCTQDSDFFTIPDCPPSTIDTVRVYPEAMGEFVFDFYSRFWFTYRRSIPGPIGGGVMTSDAGWGCMIRSGQSMLAEALSRIYLGREFRLSDLYTLEKSSEIIAKYLAIVEQFLDRTDAVFSIHRISNQGIKCKTPVGEWFGPSVLGHSMAGLSNSPIAIYMLPNRLIPKALPKYPALLLVPLRLGITRQLDVQYTSAIFSCLQSSFSVGIVGGLPQRSFYFLGHYGSSLIYLDPHIVQEALLDGAQTLKAMVSGLK
jgi:hypothetical protein